MQLKGYTGTAVQGSVHPIKPHAIHNLAMIRVIINNVKGSSAPSFAMKARATPGVGVREATAIATPRSLPGQGRGYEVQ